MPSCSSATDIDKDMAIFRGRVCSKFSYSAIREVHKRRYLLQVGKRVKDFEVNPLDMVLRWFFQKLFN